MAITDIFSEVTNRFQRNLAKGVLFRAAPAHCPSQVIPLRDNGRPYQGVNVVILWDAARKRGYSSPHWLTVRQARLLGASVRNGALSTTVVAPIKAKVDARLGEGAGRLFPPFQPFAVFNGDQIKGLDGAMRSSLPLNASAGGQRLEQARAFFAAVDGVASTGTPAVYPASVDGVAPAPAKSSAASLTNGNELMKAAQRIAHWASGDERLAKDFSFATAGRARYARVELALNFATAFLCAEFGIDATAVPAMDGRIPEWTDLLEHDNHAVFRAATYAQKSLDVLRSLAPR